MNKCDFIGTVKNGRFYFKHPVGRLFAKVNACNTSQDMEVIAEFEIKNWKPIGQPLKMKSRKKAGSYPNPIYAYDDELTPFVDILGLVGITVSVDTVRNWSPLQRMQAEDWAAKTHLAASDNDVDVPSQPEFLKNHRLKNSPKKGLHLQTHECSDLWNVLVLVRRYILDNPASMVRAEHVYTWLDKWIRRVENV